MSLLKKMGDAHEAFLASLFDGSQHKGSGNQWRNPIDGGQNRMTRTFGFSWDGKSTTLKSMSIPLAMWEKARLQAGGNRPMLGLRWYKNEKLDIARDLVVVSAHDFAEVLQSAEALHQVKDALLRGGQSPALNHQAALVVLQEQGLL